MPTCQKCKTKWTWKQTFKKSFAWDTGMNCPICENRQYPTRKTRNRFTLSLFVPLLSLLLISFGVSGLIVIGILFSSGVILLCLYPFILELSNQEEWP